MDEVRYPDRWDGPGASPSGLRPAGSSHGYRTRTEPADQDPPQLVAVARYEEQTFLDEVHAVDRYPGVPAGVMRLAWRQLREGAPACVYLPGRVQTEGLGLRVDLSEGCEEWHLVLIVATGSRYLTVRLRPRSEPVRRLCTLLYEAAAQTEAEALAAHRPQPAAAGAGADRVLQVLADAGEAGSGALSTIVLRGELQELPPTLVVTTHGFGPLARLLSAIRATGDHTATSVAQLPEVSATSAELTSAADELDLFADGVGALAQAIGAAAAEVAEGAPVLANAGDALQKVADETISRLRRAEQAVIEARDGLHRGTSWIALARIAEALLAEATVQQVDGFVQTGLDERLRGLSELLQHATIEMAVAATESLPALQSAADQIAAALAELTTFHRWLGRFRLLVTRAGLWAQLGQLKVTLDRQLVGVAALDRMRVTERICRSFRLDVDVDGLAESLEAIRDALADAPNWSSGVTHR